MTNTFNTFRKTILLSGIGFVALSSPQVRAQVSLYSFSQSVEAYSEISDADGGYSLGTPTWWPPLHNLRAWANPNDLDGTVTNGGYLQPAVGPGFPIGFEFGYNGDVFDRIGIAHGGWISFGKSSDGNQAVVIFTSDHSAGRPLSHSYWATPLAHAYQRNRIAGWGNAALRMQEMTQLIPPGPVSSLRVATVGVAPNRVCVIQFKDFRHEYGPSGSLINFQIRLYETTNVVEVRFGNTNWASLNHQVQIGLGGQTSDDFNNRKTVYEQPAFLYDWNTTAAGETNTDHCYAINAEPGQPNGSGVGPVLGRTFRWSPPACPPPAWPAEISTLAFDGALVTWPANGSEAFDYFVSSENSISGPEVASGTVTENEVYVEGLAPRTTYYIFVRSNCAGEPGVWGLGTAFTTYGGGYLACPGAPLEEDFCANTQNGTFYWHYVSDDGFSPVKINLSQGVVGNGPDAALSIWNGNAPVGSPAVTFNGELAGQTFTSTGPQIFIRLQTDAGSCGFQPWYLPLQWQAGCKDCTDALATFTVLDPDCENQEYSLEVNLFSMGSATALNVLNTQNLALPQLTASGLHTVGPFAAGEAVIVTLENAANSICNTASPQVINLPCALVDCGPTEYTICYGDNDWVQQAYQGSGSQEIGIRFLGGTIGFGDNARLYNAADPEDATPVALTGGNLVNGLFTSGTPSTDRTLILEITADNAHSCADADPLYGTSEPISFVVACYDGCVQPRATFSTNCLSQTQYEVVVNVTEIGNTGSVAINNTGGVAAITATAIGSYTVGPFTVGTAVSVEVVGASVLCTWDSPTFNPSCAGVGIQEVEAGRLSIHPNPNDGSFRLELPDHFNERTDVLVIDMAGKVVFQRSLANSGVVAMELGHLSNGLYTVIAQANGEQVTARVSIQH